MSYIIEYDIAGLILSVTLGFILFFRKSFPTKSSKYFKLITFILILASLFNLITVYTIDENGMSVVPVWLNYILFICYYSMVNSLATSSYYFFSQTILIKTTEPKFLGNPKIEEYSLFPWLISEALIISNPITKFVFYFDADKIYHYGMMLPLPYVIAFLYLGASILITTINRHTFTKRQIISIYFYVVAAVASSIIQFITKNLLIVEFISSVAILLIYLSINDPVHYTDKETEFYNQKAFSTLITQKTTAYLKKRFRIIAFSLPEIQNLQHLIGFENKTTLMNMLQQRLLKQFKKNQIFRLSTSNFAFVIDDDSDLEAKIIEKLKDTVADPFVVSNVPINLTIRFTILKCPIDSSTLENILELISFSLAQLQFKENGTVEPVDKSILAEKKRESKILMMLRKAVMNKQFYVVYQPIYNIEKGKFTTAEALVRLTDEDLGSLSPEEFIPIAEKNGMVLEIGDFVFKSVCKFLATERPWEKGIEYIHVNLSVIQCMQEKLSLQLLSILNSYNLDSKYINLEITETSAIISSEILSSNMLELKKHNINFSLDDFGSGFSNTSSLIKYPYSSIKLDKSLIHAANKSQKATFILKNTIEMIKSLNMKVVAEGIETEEEVNLLKSLGCDFIQGYFFSKPVPDKQFLEILK